MGEMPVWMRRSMLRVVPTTVTSTFAGMAVMSSRCRRSGGSRRTTPTGIVRWVRSSWPRLYAASPSATTSESAFRPMFSVNASRRNRPSDFMMRSAPVIRRSRLRSKSGVRSSLEPPLVRAPSAAGRGARGPDGARIGVGCSRGTRPGPGIAGLVSSCLSAFVLRSGAGGG